MEIFKVVEPPSDSSFMTILVFHLGCFYSIELVTHEITFFDELGLFKSNVSILNEIIIVSKGIVSIVRILIGEIK